MSPRGYDMRKRQAAVEETRRKILEATMELHGTQGILATSWEDIAERAGVATGTVYRHFPSLDELVPACGELSMERLSLPDASQRREAFSGLKERGERIARLLAECFAIYERGELVIAAIRRERERSELPPVAEAHEGFEGAIDALVEEALEPFAPPERERRALRALCDYDTWRALRRQGLAGEEAVAALGELTGAG